MTLTGYLNSHLRKANIIRELIQKENRTEDEIKILIRRIFSEFGIYEVAYQMDWSGIANQIKYEKPEAAHLIKEALMQLHEAGENS